MSIRAAFQIKHDDFNLDVDMTIAERGVTALFGPSGCGKTSLLRAISGLDKHPDGILTMGTTIWQNNEVFIPPHQRAIGYVFQEANLFEHLSIAENIKYGLKRCASSTKTIDLNKLIKLLGIEHLLERKPHKLSGGEKQRVAIARALATSPKLLLMDEPLASLDHKKKQEILPYLESLSQELEIPVVYVSHSPDEVARLANHLIILKNGKILGSGEISEMLTRLDLPLAHRSDAEALIEVKVGSYDKQYQLNTLIFAGGSFLVPGKALEPGSKVRLRIPAQDVSITLAPQSETSILNIFPAIIDELLIENKAQVTVRLKIDETIILARITRKSIASLGLTEGKQVYVQVKGIAVLA